MRLPRESGLERSRAVWSGLDESGVDNCISDHVVWTSQDESGADQQRGTILAQEQNEDDLKLCKGPRGSCAARGRVTARTDAAKAT